tara:strand:+ start:10023 stop:10334 length:312 start_codon:yes stop_codon:yes gene_type:complete
MKKKFSLYNQTNLDTNHVANLTMTLKYAREDHIRKVATQYRDIEEIDGEKYPSTKWGIQKSIDFLEKSIEEIDFIMKELCLTPIERKDWEKLQPTKVKENEQS